MKGFDRFIRPGIRRNKRTLSFIVTLIVSLSMLCACGDDSNASAEKGSGNAPTEAAQAHQSGDDAGSSGSGESSPPE